MKGRRWNEKEDQLLKESVLHSIQTGGTQLDAFAEVGRQIGRTPGACGFRWNAVLREKYLQLYTDAKRKRVYRQLEKKRNPELHSFSHMMKLLKKVEGSWEQLQRDVEKLDKELKEKEEKLEQLIKENKRLREEKYSYEYYKKEVKERYQELIQMLQRVDGKPETGHLNNSDKKELDRINVETNNPSTS
jgi:prespore-specific regulator